MRFVYYIYFGFSWYLFLYPFYCLSSSFTTVKCFCFIRRHLWYRFLIYAPASLTWSCSIVGEIEIYSSGFQGLRGLIKLRQDLQQMEIFCCKRPANRGIPCGAHWLRVAPPVFIGFYEFSFFNKFCLLGVQVVARSGDLDLVSPLQQVTPQ